MMTTKLPSPLYGIHVQCLSTMMPARSFPLLDLGLGKLGTSFDRQPSPVCVNLQQKQHPI